MTEASALLSKIRSSINASRNIKTDIKTEVLESAMRMWQILKDAEEGRKHKTKEETKETQTEQERNEVTSRKEEKEREQLTGKINEHLKLLQETKEEIEKTREEISKHREHISSQRTYASAVSGTPKVKMTEVAPTLHSIVVSSLDEMETGEEVVERLRKAVNATNDGIRIDRVRKAKDRKVIVGCQDEGEIKRVKQNIQKNGKNLKIEDIKNKDPLVIIRHVMTNHTDEEIVKALKLQNKHLLGELKTGEDRIEVTHRRRTRNPLVAHVILRVSPQIWQSFTNAGAVFVDVQRVKVEDQSPLVQCSKCLGYGHGRRFCHASLEACTHCGGPHKRAECADWLAAEPATCCNCQRAKLTDVGHNAYSEECPVRKKWDILARSCVAYF